MEAAPPTNRETRRCVWCKSVSLPRTAQNCLGRSSPAIRRVNGSKRFPSPPARINPQRWLCESLPLNSIEPNPSVCGPHLWCLHLALAERGGSALPKIPPLAFKVSRFQFVPRNTDRAGERRKGYCRERYGHVCKLSQRMSKCRQKGGTRCAFTWNLCFDAVLTFVASYWAWIVSRAVSPIRGSGKDDRSI